MMTVRYVVLVRDATTVYVKCFYEDGRNYGEFYLTVDQKRGTISFSSKEGYYAAVLAAAFERAMQM